MQQKKTFEKNEEKRRKTDIISMKKGIRKGTTKNEFLKLMQRKDENSAFFKERLLFKQRWS